MVDFANLAIEGLGFASPVLGSIGTPLTVNQTAAGRPTTPTDTYAVAIAVIVSLMFVTLLLAAGMLAHRALGERLLAAGPRPGLARAGLLAEKVVLSAAAPAR